MSNYSKQARLIKAVQRLHGTFWIARRAWNLLKRLEVIERAPAPFLSLRKAMGDSWAQTAVIETCKLYEWDLGCASLATVLFFNQGIGIEDDAPFLSFSDGDREAIDELREARNKIMAHADRQTDSGSLAAVPRLLEIARPLILTTKERVLKQPPLVLHEGRLVEFFEVERAAGELGKLFERLPADH